MNNFYNPNSYNGYMNNPYQMQNFTQPSVNSIMTVFVSGESGAASYPVGAGNTVMLIDFDSKMFWIKSTDTNGVPQQLRRFNFVEQTAEKQANNEDAPVTRKEFEELKQMLDDLLK